MIPASTPAKAFHIPSLDGWRAISILVVFLSHAGLSRVVPGLFGVTVFFFLSGYLITTLLRLESEQTGRVSLRGFYGRRALRILPPFYLTLGLILLVTWLGGLPGGFTWSAVAAQAAQLANYQEIFGRPGQPPGTEVFWSLAVEEHFYLVFPFLYLGLRWGLPERRHQFYALAGLAAVVLVWRIGLVWGGAIPLDGSLSHHPRLCHATDTRLDSLLFGCMLAVYGNPVLDPTRFRRWQWFGIGLPLGLGVLVLSFVLRSPAFRETLRYTLQGVALFPLFIVTIRFADLGIFRVLNWRWIRFLGLLSYSIYLTHAAILAGVQHWLPIPNHVAGWERLLPSVGQGLLAFVLCLGAAALLHYGVEKPCARWRRKLSRVQVPGREIPRTALGLGGAAAEVALPARRGLLTPEAAKPIASG